MTSDPNAPVIRTVAVCAGSGGSMFSGVTADVYFTGEMQHHEVLAAVAKGTNVILCAYRCLTRLVFSFPDLHPVGGHTNTERGYLPILAEKLRERIHTMDLRELSPEELIFAPVIKSLQVDVSEMDQHPLQIV